jgi:hypothetical protein
LQKNKCEHFRNYFKNIYKILRKITGKGKNGKNSTGSLPLAHVRAAAPRVRQIAGTGRSRVVQLEPAQPLLHEQ